MIEAHKTRSWTDYNAAQVEEKVRLTELLADLCSGIPQPEQTKGRPRLPLSDMVFAAVYKVYVGFSSRRFTCDLREAYADGLIDSTPHFNSVNRYLANPDLTGVLKELVSISSLPLKSVETDFAVDASGFSTSTFACWKETKYGKQYGKREQTREWFKAHLICGVSTNIVTGMDISGRSHHDSYFFKPLVKQTSENFQLREVSADKAYLGRQNMELVESFGATPFIPFKSNTVVPKDDSVWTKMWHLFMFNRESFMDRYHKRSNVESAFSMTKRKFGSSVRGKSDVAQVNEVLAKVFCHNICVLILATRKLGVEPLFYGG